MHQSFYSSIQEQSNNSNGNFYMGEQNFGGNENLDIEFKYSDADSLENEIAELYSYTEGPEFQLNLKAFEEVCADLGVLPLWQSLSVEERTSIVIRLSDQLELSDATLRSRASRAMLYIVQGCWGEVQSDCEQASWSRQNVFLLLRSGLWSFFIQMLCLEIENCPSNASSVEASITVTTSAPLRVVLSILYTIVETMRCCDLTEGAIDSGDREIREAFIEDLALGDGEGELLAVTLLGMVTRFCNSSAPHFPIRKTLMLLWKVLLLSLGGTPELWKMKQNLRALEGVGECWEETLSVVATLRASSPPTPPIPLADLLDQENNQRKRPFRRQMGLIKQGSLDDSVAEIDLAPPPPPPSASAACDGESGESPIEGCDEGDSAPDLPVRADSPAPNVTPAAEPEVINIKNNKGLPWSPKVRGCDIDAFLETSRLKFVGFTLRGDRESLAGLPPPIHEGVGVLSKHVYVSLTEVQIRREEELMRCPLSRPEPPVPETPTEILYQALLGTLPQCMIALLKVLLAAAPTSKSKTDSINVVAEVLPDQIPMSVVQSMKLGIDVNRHKEVLVKSVSSILLLLLKHFKLNHVYQFEFLSQHLVFANCIPLILKFFNQNIMAYVQAKNTIDLLDFPACVIGDPPEMTPEYFEALSPPAERGTSSNTNNPGGAAGGGGTSSNFCCWRNMFSCVNLVRILNKLCKWKHTRIVMLVVFKSAPILRRTLKVRHATLQLYVLKLLKMQTKYLGRQWRKTNMKTLSAIYQKVRHRLTDDWAFGNDPDARPWDFQTEECTLRAAVDRFNCRRYQCVPPSPQPGGPVGSGTVQPQPAGGELEEPVDNCLFSVLGRPVPLSDDFKRHYDVWLKQEVLSANIDWDQLLTQKEG